MLAVHFCMYIIITHYETIHSFRLNNEKQFIWFILNIHILFIIVINCMCIRKMKCHLHFLWIDFWFFNVPISYPLISFRKNRRRPKWKMKFLYYLCNSFVSIKLFQNKMFLKIREGEEKLEARIGERKEHGRRWKKSKVSGYKDQETADRPSYINSTAIMPAFVCVWLFVAISF